MITKGQIVDFAIRKLVGDRETSLTGISPSSYSKAVLDLEGLMARWQSDGIDLLYNFAENHDTTSAPKQDSGLELWAWQAVGYNLALVIADDFHREPSDSVVTNASKGWRSIERKFSHSVRVKPALPLPAGSGEAGRRRAKPASGFKND